MKAPPLPPTPAAGSGWYLVTPGDPLGRSCPWSCPYNPASMGASSSWQGRHVSGHCWGRCCGGGGSPRLTVAPVLTAGGAAGLGTWFWCTGQCGRRPAPHPGPILPDNAGGSRLTGSRLQQQGCGVAARGHQPLQRPAGPPLCLEHQHPAPGVSAAAPLRPSADFTSPLPTAGAGDLAASRPSWRSLPPVPVGATCGESPSTSLADVAAVTWVQGVKAAPVACPPMRAAARLGVAGGGGRRRAAGGGRRSRHKHLYECCGVYQSGHHAVPRKMAMRTCVPDGHAPIV